MSTRAPEVGRGVFLAAVLLFQALGLHAQDLAPGTRLSITPNDMPAPYATRSAGNSPDYIQRPAGVVPRTLPGFKANLFANKLEHPRWMTVAENGDVFLAEPHANRIVLLRDEDGDGMADVMAPYLRGLTEDPHGMGIKDGFFYFADRRGVWRVPYKPGAYFAEAEPERVTPEGAFGGPGGHWTRILTFHPTQDKFVVSIGSQSNMSEESPPRAAIQEFSLDGSRQRTLASGLRNPVGTAYHPDTGELFTVVNERDDLGDELVPDFLTHVRDGGFYGWPYSYIGAHPQPGLADRRPDLVAKAIVPDLLFRSHSAPLGLVFYNGDMFPEEYRGDAFVALHGSWNAAAPRGYMVVRVPFENGRPVGHYEVFASGFWHQGKGTAEVWGRPAGLAVAKDGSLLVADDSGQVVWRIAYVGK